MRYYPLLILTLLLLSGCTSTSPSVNEYTLLSPPSEKSDKQPFFLKSLSIAQSKSIASLSGKNIVYFKDSGETGSYLYSRWSDTPSALIQRSLLKSLYEHSLFTIVSPSASLAQSDMVLESDLDAFYHRFSKDESEGYIDITYRLIDSHTRKALASKRFIITSPAQTMDARGGVEALKLAQIELDRQCIEWLMTLTKEIK